MSHGDLMLLHLSHKDDGLYQCTVANHAGHSVCVVEVKVSGGCRGSGPGGPVAGRVGLEKLVLYIGASAGSAFPLPSVHSSARGSWEALGETCRHEGLTCISPYIPPCVSRGPEIPWVPHPLSHRHPAPATPG